MSRPNIVRADTLDLQATDQPSAQDHSNQHTHGDVIGRGSLAPHQDASMRHMQQERNAEQEYLAEAWGSGRSSHEGSELLDEDTDFLTDGGAVPAGMRPEDHAMQQNGTQVRSSEDSDMTDGENEEHLADDDMMDKISSSPSIDDGGYPPPSPFTNWSSRRRLSSGLRGSDHEKHHVPRLPSPGACRFNHHLDGEYILAQENPDDLEFDLGNITRPTIHDRPRAVSSSTADNVDDSSLVTQSLSPTTFASKDDVKPNFLDPHEGRYLYPTDSELSHAASFESRLDFSEEELDEAISMVDSLARDDDMTGTLFPSSPHSVDSATEDDDDYSDTPFPPETRFVDSGWGGECLQDTEDIDFEFVYALHTFVATVEGQANATKGDTMVLLDDSNSYWWLVRVVKDASIGYLPAEHIETPTERLARLNKHRNIDLSATMLSDNLEKSKNPLKKAMRRRNAKMVQFTTPTYYEASEVEWSDDDNERDSVDLDVDSHSNQGQQQTEGEDAAVLAANDSGSGNELTKEVSPASGGRNMTTDPSMQDTHTVGETERPSEDSFEGPDGTSSRSRNGTMRNTDSFFKDNSAEPKKMSLTPSLLRESESGDNSPRSSESKDKSPIAETFDQMDKAAGLSPTSDKYKDDKRRRDKKPGMLSGLFKRKEKKIKVDEAAGGTVRTQQEGDNILTSPTNISPADSGNNSPRDRSPHAPKRQVSNGKLVKSPPQSGLNSTVSSTTPSGLSSGISSPPNGATMGPTLSPQTSASTLPQQAATKSPQGFSQPSQSFSGRQPLRIQTQAQPEPEAKKEGGILSPLNGLMSQSNEPKKEKLKKAKQRMELDMDSSPERDPETAIKTRNAVHTPPPRIAPSPPQQQPFGGEMVSPVDTSTLHDRYPPVLEPSKTAVHSESPVSPTTPPESTSTAQTAEPFSEAEPKTSSTAPSSTAPDPNLSSREVSEEPTVEHVWDDNALRNYLDSSTSDVKDLLWRVHDNTGATPVPHDHPIMIDLGYDQQQKQLNDISTRLDGLLNSFLERSSARQKEAAMQ